MNVSRRAVALSLLALLATTLALGCKSPPPPMQKVSEAAPGDWADTKVSITFVPTERAVKVTIAVTGYPKDRGYARKFELFDGRNDSIGHRVFGSRDVPKETFILDPAPKRLTIEVTSSEHSMGIWRSDQRKVPPKK